MDEGWERQRCSCSLVLPLFWLFPTATPRCSQHPSVSAALGTAEQEFGLVSALLALRHGLDPGLAYVNPSCGAGGGNIPPGNGGISRHEGAGSRSVATAL